MAVPWEPLPDRDIEPAPLSAPLDELLARLSGVSRSAIEVVMDQWRDIVGPDAAAVSDPVRLRDGVLTVRVDDSVWASELRWLEPTVIERVRALAPDGAPHAVKVVVRSR